MKLKLLSDTPAFGGMEFSTFKLKHGVSEAELFTAVDKMVEGLYSGEVGFLGHAVLEGADGIYVDVSLQQMSQNPGTVVSAQKILFAQINMGLPHLTTAIY